MSMASASRSRERKEKGKKDYSLNSPGLFLLGFIGLLLSFGLVRTVWFIPVIIVSVLIMLAVVCFAHGVHRLELKLFFSFAAILTIGIVLISY